MRPARAQNYEESTMIKKCLSLIFFLAWPALGLLAGQEKAAPNTILGGGKATQVGVVVKDIEKSAKAYAEILGVPVPAWELTDPVEKAHTLYLGKSSPARAKLAFIQLPNIVVELIEPVSGPSTWQDFLETKGEGVHHLAFEVKDMDRRLAELKAKGLSLIQRGDYIGGRYCYVDATAQLGLILELLENF
jgi:methylmalonyl-CoA/ethylmalonyl-CoA epimerase